MPDIFENFKMPRNLKFLIIGANSEPKMNPVMT